MTQSQYITVRETAQMLGISEKKVMDLIEEKKLQAYRIADKFLRLKKVEVQALQNSGNIATDNIKIEYTPAERFRDFLYFNDFYILCSLIIASLVYIILFT